MAISLNARELFTRAVGHLGALAVGGVEKSEQLRLCKETRGYLLELAAKTEKAVEPLNQKNRKLEQDLESYHRDEVAQNERRQRLKAKLRELNAKIAGYKSRRGDLSREMERAQAELNSIEAKIRDEKSDHRRNLILGALAGIGGLLIAGVINNLTQERDSLARRVENLRQEQNGLNAQKRQVEQKLEEKKKKEKDLKKDMNSLKERISIQGRKIKECGADLTKVRNLAVQLKEMMEKYRFLGHRVEELRDAVELDILDVNDVIGAKKQLEAIRQSEVTKRYLLTS